MDINLNLMVSIEAGKSVLQALQALKQAGANCPLEGSTIISLDDITAGIDDKKTAPATDEIAEKEREQQPAPASETIEKPAPAGTKTEPAEATPKPAESEKNPEANDRLNGRKKSEDDEPKSDRDLMVLRADRCRIAAKNGYSLDLIRSFTKQKFGVGTVGEIPREKHSEWMKAFDLSFPLKGE